MSDNEKIKFELKEDGLYCRMYLHLFNAVTDAINAHEQDKMRSILIQAQIFCEEIYTAEDR